MVTPDASKLLKASLALKRLWTFGVQTFSIPLLSVPDLSEYRVWLGVSDIREGAADLLKKQEVSISQVICGPEGSSLVLLRLAQ